MGGTVVMIVILLLFPVMVLMSGAIGAAIVSTVLKRDRDAEYQDTEHLALSEAQIDYTGSLAKVE